jgi:hypothetical protein
VVAVKVFFFRICILKGAAARKKVVAEKLAAAGGVKASTESWKAVTARESLEVELLRPCREFERIRRAREEAVVYVEEVPRDAEECRKSWTLCIELPAALELGSEYPLGGLSGVHSA